MLFLMMNWFLSTLSLVLLTYLFPGFRVNGFDAALIAAATVALVSAIWGTLLKEVAAPLPLVLSCFFLFVIGAFLFRLSALLVPGFVMTGMPPALAGAAVLVGVQIALKAVPEREAQFDSRENLLASSEPPRSARA